MSESSLLENISSVALSRSFLSRLRSLRNNSQKLQPQLLQEQLIVAHTLQTLNELELLLDIDGGLDSKSFQDFFASLWNKTKGTALCYTALPDHPLTLLLCELAIAVTHELNHTMHYSEATQTLGVIEILMPGLCTESIHDDYPDLQPTDINGLKTILSTHILSDDGHYLLPVALLVKSHSLSEPLLNPYYDYTFIAEDTPVAASSDIASGGTALLPQEASLSHSTTKPGFLTPREVHRLYQHSPWTKNLYDAWLALETSATNDNHLLGQLNLLLRYLHLGSAGGLGHEDNASQLAYAAIARFNVFYIQLSTTAHEAVPQPLRQEITILLTINKDRAELTRLKHFQLLFSLEASSLTPGQKDALDALSKDETKHLKQAIAEKRPQLKHFDPAATVVGSCLDTRKSRLKSAMGDEKAQQSLASITISATSQAQHLKRCKENLDDARRALQKALFLTDSSRLTKAYRGHDSLGIHASLLQHYKIAFDVKTLSELTQTLTQLSAEEMSDVLQVETYADAVLDRIVSLENLIILSLELPLHGFSAFYQTLFTRLQTGLLSTVEELSQLLSVLDDTKFIQLIRVANDKEVIKTASNFGVLLKNNLSPDQCTAVCEVMKDTLAQLIKTAADFKNILRPLTPKQCTAVCESMKDTLIQLIKTAVDFKEVFIFLTSKQRIAVYETIKDKLPQNINTIDDFKEVFIFLTLEQRTVFYESMKEKLPQLINTIDNFNDVFIFLKVEQRTVFYESMKEKLPQLINTIDDFKKVCGVLKLEQHTVVYEAMKDKLPKLIKTAGDLKHFLMYLEPEWCTAVCEAMKGRLPSLIETAQDFNSLLINLSNAQCRKVCETLGDTLLGLIKNECDFEQALQDLTSEQRNAVCEGIENLYKKQHLFFDVNDIPSSRQRIYAYTDFKKKYSLHEIDTKILNHWPTKIKSLFQPISNRSARFFSGHWNTSGGPIAQTIIQACNEIKDTQSIPRSLIDLIEGSLKHSQDRGISFTGETSMRLMCAWEILNRVASLSAQHVDSPSLQPDTKEANTQVNARPLIGLTRNRS